MKRIVTLIALSLATSAAFAQGSAEEIQALSPTKRAGVTAVQADSGTNPGIAREVRRATFSFLTEASPL